MTIPCIRSYRGEPSRPIPVWNGILEHLSNMGMAVWLYLWCLDRITREQDGLGYVLGGAPVKIEKIALELGRSERALRRDLKTLQSKYLRLRRTPYGYIIHVLNSHKFGIWRPWDRSAKNGKSPANLADLIDKSGRSKEDPAADPTETQQQEAAAAADPIWSLLGFCRPDGPKIFQEAVLFRFSRCTGEPYSELFELAIRDCQAKGVKLPRRIYDTKRRLEERERAAAKPHSYSTVVSDADAAAMGVVR